MDTASLIVQVSARQQASLSLAYRANLTNLLEVFVGFGEEVVYLVVEVVSVFAEGGMARVRDYPEVGVGNVLIDEDGVGNGDQVVVAADDE